MKHYVPEFLGVILALLLINVWYLAGVAIEESILPIEYEFSIKLFSVIIGAFIGAYSAFKLDQSEKKLAEHKENRIVMNRTLFILVQQINAIKLVKRDLDKYQSDFEKAFNLPALAQPDYSDLKFEQNKLSFLIEHHYAHILMELRLEQSRFEQAMGSIKIRNEFYINEVQPLVSKHELTGKKLPLKEYHYKLGERVFKGAFQGIEQVCFHVEETETSLMELFNKVSIIAKELFPKEIILNWSEKPKSQ